MMRAQTVGPAPKARDRPHKMLTVLVMTSRDIGSPTHGLDSTLTGGGPQQFLQPARTLLFTFIMSSMIRKGSRSYPRVGQPLPVSSCDDRSTRIKPPVRHHVASSIRRDRMPPLTQLPWLDHLPAGAFPNRWRFAGLHSWVTTTSAGDRSAATRKQRIRFSASSAERLSSSRTT